METLYKLYLEMNKENTTRQQPVNGHTGDGLGDSYGNSFGDGDGDGFGDGYNLDNG